MIRLVYVSELRPDVDERGLEEIVDYAAKRNATIEVTGILALEGRRICQVLEGTPETIVPLFAEISQDDRHDRVVEIDRREIAQRKFQNWSMVRRPMVDIVVAVLTD